MQIICLDQVFDLKSNEADIHQCLNLISTILQKSDFHLSHLVIDDVEVYDHYEEYLLEHMDDVQRVEAVGMTADQLKVELLVSAHQYLDKALPSMIRLADDFYSNPNAETWGGFEQFLEGLQWVTEMARSYQAHSHVQSDTDIGDIAKRLQSPITELFEALNNKDAITVGDLIKHEIIPILVSLSEAVQRILSKEGTDYDPN